MKVVQRIPANKVDERNRTAKDTKLSAFEAGMCACDAPGLLRRYSIVHHLAFDIFAED